MAGRKFFTFVLSAAIFVLAAFAPVAALALPDRDRKLIEAAMLGNGAEVKSVIDAGGADIDARDSDGWTALMYAAMQGNAEMVKLLLEKGAKTGIKNKNGTTALTIASRKGNAEIVKLLESPPAEAPAKTPPPAVAAKAEEPPPPEEEYDYAGSRSTFAGEHPAELYLENNSQRDLTVKVMKVAGEKKALKYGPIIKITPMEKHGPVLFYETGDYYLKTRSDYPGRSPIFGKGSPFSVTVGPREYSVLTIKYSVTESTIDPLSGVSISKSDFDRNTD